MSDNIEEHKESVVESGIPILHAVLGAGISGLVFLFIIFLIPNTETSRFVNNNETEAVETFIPVTETVYVEMRPEILYVYKW